MFLNGEISAKDRENLSFSGAILAQKEPKQLQLSEMANNRRLFWFSQFMNKNHLRLSATHLRPEAKLALVRRLHITSLTRCFGQNYSSFNYPNSLVSVAASCLSILFPKTKTGIFLFDANSITLFSCWATLFLLAESEASTRQIIASAPSISSSHVALALNSFRIPASWKRTFQTCTIPKFMKGLCTSFAARSVNLINRVFFPEPSSPSIMILALCLKPNYWRGEGVELNSPISKFCDYTF